MTGTRRFTAEGAAMRRRRPRPDRFSVQAVVPDSSTHGSSADRVVALKRGLQTGDVSACGLGR